MEPRKKKKCHWNYDEADVQECIRSIDNKMHTVYAASKAYGIPQSTVRFRFGSKWSKKTRKGPPSILSPEEESKIVEWLKNMEQKGFPVVKATLLYKVKSFLQAVPRENPFTNNTPGRKWFQAFLQRNPTITIRKPETVSAASAKVSETDIRSWFSHVSAYFVKQGLSRIFEDPSRIYNGDETSFFLHPKTKAVLASVGNRNVYETEHADNHTNITVMFSFGADGSVIPPDVILPLKRIRPDILRGFSGEWGIGKSEKGWMDVPNFLLYVRNILYPFLLRKGVTFPVVYFVDGHSSHTAMEVADLCLDLGIILVALYPNTTRITQPADVSIFKPLKNAWQSAVSEWRGKNGNEILTLKFFGSVLQTAMHRGIKSDSIVNGFRVCGLYPFCSDNVDYSKCIARSSSRTLEFNVQSLNNPAVECNSSPTRDTHGSTQEHVGTRTIKSPIFLNSAVIFPSTCVKEALVTIGEERLHKLKTSNTLTEEEKVIRSLYENLLKPMHDQVCFNNQVSPLVETRNQMDDVRGQFSSGVQSCNTNSVLNEPEECGVQLPNIESVQTDMIPIESFEGSNMDMDGTEVIGEYFVNETTGEVKEVEHGECFSTVMEYGNTSPTLNLSDAITTNASCEKTMSKQPSQLIKATDNCHRRKTSISSFLQTPATPKRSEIHRNYKKKFFPVLTAGERLDELRRIEQEKENEILRKAENGRKREEARKEAEIMRRLKAEAREHKRQQTLLKKQERESLRKMKTARVKELRKQKQELLETLKLKQKVKKRMR